MNKDIKRECNNEWNVYNDDDGDDDANHEPLNAKVPIARPNAPWESKLVFKGPSLTTWANATDVSVRLPKVTDPTNHLSTNQK